MVRLKGLREKSQPRGIHLLVGAPKFATADLVVEKAVELGIDSITFFNAARSQRNLKGEQITKRLERMHRVRDAAIKQSLSDTLAEISYLPSLAELLIQLDNASNSGFQGLICLLPEQAADRELAKITDFFPANPNPARMSAPVLENSRKDDETYVLVGPEGGFERSEIELAFEHQFSPISLGPTRLRTETACILAAGILLVARS